MSEIVIKPENQPLANLILWARYNSPRIIDVYNLNDVIDIFKRATEGNHKTCNCTNKGKAVNEYWSNWHCTWCLKPKS